MTLPDGSPEAQAKSSSFRALVSTVYSMLATRLEMAGLELAIARKNFFAAVIFGTLSAFFGLLALSFIGIALLVIFWDSYRVEIACGLAIFYVVLALLFLAKCRNLMANMPYAFELTLQELKADAKTLRETNLHSPATTESEQGDGS